ncbi:MAG: hypothetical protein ABDH28_07090, partial [Brevinematia bacterium]
GDRYPGGKVERREVVIREDELRKVGLSIEDVKKEWLKVYDMYVEEEKRRGGAGWVDVKYLELFEEPPYNDIDRRLCGFRKKVDEKYEGKVSELKRELFGEDKPGVAYIMAAYWFERFNTYFVVWCRIFNSMLQEVAVSFIDKDFNILWRRGIPYFYSVMFYNKCKDVVISTEGGFVVLRDIIYKY